MKEWAYQFTVKAGKISFRGCGGDLALSQRCFIESRNDVQYWCAISVGEKWAVLDPLAAIIVSAFIIKALGDW